MRIAKEKGLTLEGYRKLPRRERYAWYLFFILANEKESWAYEKSKPTPQVGSTEKLPSNYRDYM